MTDTKWICCRQRSGPLVKECRSLRPRLSQADDPYTTAEKRALKKRMDSAVCHGPVDRLELLLALFGYEGTHYEMSFDDEYLPSNFKEVRSRLSTFFKRCKRWRKGNPFDYIYAIEYGSQHCRYHAHLVLRDSEFSPAEVQYLWRYGWVDDSLVLRDSGGYRRLAKYFNKEPSDGFFLPVGRHPWSCSRTLRAKLPPAEKWEDESGIIEVPKAAFWRSSPAGPECVPNEFGVYYYYSYINPKTALYLE